LNQITVEGFQTENLVSFHSTSSDLNLWIEGEPTDGCGVTLGAGTCAADGSVCALDRDCPGSQCVSGIVNAQQVIAMRGVFHGRLALGPAARDAYGAPGEKSAGIQIEGSWGEQGLEVRIHPSANVPLDLSGLRSGEPLPIPTSYAGIFTPQLPLSYHPTDCTTLTKGQWQQQCCDRDSWSCYVCDPDNGGASPTLCDASVDWVRINQSGGVVDSPGSRALSPAEAKGGLVTNSGATRPIVLTLPEANAGLCLKVALTAPFDVDVKPSRGDRILRGTGSEGGSLSSDGKLGSVVELCAVDARTWVVTSRIGTWTEGN
jgi:hypothetical protein